MHPTTGLAELVEALSFSSKEHVTFWTYMLHCADRTFYTGHTEDLEKRVREHELGLVPGYTSSRRPVKLVWSQAFSTRDQAREAEQQIKGWGKPKKLALIRGDWCLISALAKGRQKGASTSSAKPGSVFLHPHSEHLPSEPFSLEVRFRTGGGALRLHYRLTGPVDLVRVPQPARPQRTDDLWRRTCFEAFARPQGGKAYIEFNLSPSTEWAAYQFASHRKGMQALPTAVPRVRAERNSYALDLNASVPLPNAVNPLHLNLTAVIEEISGRKSYWALAHPPSGPPDFHHPDCFVLELPPASTA